MARRSKTDDFRFEGFESPNTTPVPDVVFDQFLSKLGEAELKALLYIIRRTFGFKKDRDPISFNQFLRGITTRKGYVLDEGCGIKDRTTLSKALKSLEEKGIVLSEKGVDERGENVTTVYSLRFKNSSAQGVVGNSYHPSMNNPPPVVGSSYPQETVKQQTDINHSNLRKASPKKKQTDEELPVEQGSIQTGIPPIAGSSDLQSEPAAAVRGLAAIGDVLATKRRRSQRYDEDRQVIVDLLSDFRREFNDQATLKQSVSRCYNLLQRSDLEISTFTSRMYEARAITKEHSASITSVLAGSISLSAKMAYWFSVLEDLLGLKPTDTTPSGPSGEQS